MSFTRLRRPLAVLALAGAVAVSSAAAQTQVPPVPDRWATDEAGFLSSRTVEALDARLESFEQQTGHQVLVWIGRTLGKNAVLEDWAVRTFEAWKVGRRGLDDGLVLFIFAEDRQVRIEVGYGLEDKVPDVYAYRVIDNILIPGFRAGRPDEAVGAAVTALLGYISGEGTGAPRGRSTVHNIFGGLVVLILIIIFITNPSLAFWLLINILGGGRGGGRGGGWGGGGWGGGGGGGFSGGGGRSGGGGASGSW